MAFYQFGTGGGGQLKNHRGFVFVFAGKDGEEGRCQDARTESEAIRPKKATVVTLHCYLGTVHVQWAHASANINYCHTFGKLVPSKIIPLLKITMNPAIF